MLLQLLCYGCHTIAIRTYDRPENPSISPYLCQGLSWADAGGPARGWAGPGPPARPGPPIVDMMGRGPARAVKFSEDGPRPGPAHQIFRGWATARPSPSHFQKFTARPGPAHHMAARPMKHGLYMGRPDNYVGRPVDLTGRPMCCSVPKRACIHYADVKF